MKAKIHIIHEVCLSYFRSINQSTELSFPGENESQNYNDIAKINSLLNWLQIIKVRCKFLSNKN